ncbi:hypothetical protein C8R43DRAFT_1124109 [Mycena crocata]|nr:hypothetical protein C8R43DRAFT_1124109 [Mycena crocata]
MGVCPGFRELLSSNTTFLDGRIAPQAYSAATTRPAILDCLCARIVDVVCQRMIAVQAEVVVPKASIALRLDALAPQANAPNLVSRCVLMTITAVRRGTSAVVRYADGTKGCQPRSTTTTSTTYTHTTHSLTTTTKTIITTTQSRSEASETPVSGGGSGVPPTTSDSDTIAPSDSTSVAAVSVTSGAANNTGLSTAISPRTGALIGGIIGGVLLLVGLLGLFICCLRRRRQRREAHRIQEPTYYEEDRSVYSVVIPARGYSNEERGLVYSEEKGLGLGRAQLESALAPVLLRDEQVLPNRLRDTRQLAIERKIEATQRELEQLLPLETVSRGSIVEVGESEVHREIERIREHIDALRDARRSAWARGLSDEEPLCYSNQPYLIPHPQAGSDYSPSSVASTFPDAIVVTAPRGYTDEKEIEGAPSRSHPSSSSASPITLTDTEKQNDLRHARQTGLERKILETHLQIERLRRQEQLKLERGEESDLQQEIQRMEDHITELRDARGTNWAQGLSDEEPVCYSSPPYATERTRSDGARTRHDLRLARQIELERKIRDARLELERLIREGSNGGDVHQRIHRTQEYLASLEQVQESPWALGVSDSEPACYSELPYLVQKEDVEETQNELREARQMELERKIEEIQAELDPLVQDAQARSEHGEANDLQQQIQTMRDQLALLQQARETRWARGLTDEDPPYYYVQAERSRTRHMQLEAKIRNIQGELEELIREKDEEETWERREVRQHIRRLQDHIVALLAARTTPWAAGLSDQEPPCLYAAPEEISAHL